MSNDRAMNVHATSIVIDAVCPLVMEDPQYLDWYREGGVTVLAPTVGSTENAHTTLRRIAAWHRWVNEREHLQWIRRAGDVELAKRNNRLGVYLHIQGTDPIEDNLDLIYAYKALGVGVVQLTYNSRNRVGDGCEERTDSGLSRFGIKLVEHLNAARVIVDCSHTGPRTSLEAIEHSAAPVILSHSNVASVHPNVRNVSSELLHAVAKSGGVIGAVGFPGMVKSVSRPSMDDFIAHIDAIVQTVGIDHVGLGMDYYAGQAGVADDEAAIKGYYENLSAGIWTAAYPPPPHYYPAGIETPRTLPNITARLLERGYSESDVKKVLGGNWLRVMQAVWG